MLKIDHYRDVTRFELARSLPGPWRYWTVAYLIDGMMIDTGCVHTARELDAALDNTPLHRIVNTHAHEDHIGCNDVLQRTRNPLEILAHPRALPVLTNPRDTQPLQPYRRLFWGYPAPSRASALAEETLLETEHYTFQVIYTPGHSPDHLCLYEPDHGWLFTGDAFTGGKDRAMSADYDSWQIIASLKRLARLPAEWLFPGCARVRENPARVLQEKIAFLAETGEQILDLRGRGWQIEKIARKLFGGLMPVEFITLGHFSRKNMVRAFLKQKDHAMSSHSTMT
jgi:glyoxylase-like metal-dependent hydrolase (beta-lactamase superfamily II)